MRSLMAVLLGVLLGVTLTLSFQTFSNPGSQDSHISAASAAGAAPSHERSAIREESRENRTAPVCAVPTPTPPKPHPYWDPEADAAHPCCGMASLGAIVYRSTPNDISELLPIFELYVRDPQVETIVEAGSFTGVSTTTLLRSIRSNKTKMAATMDLTITTTVEALYKCELKCGAPGRTLFTVEGSDLVTPIPFVDLSPRPDKGPRPIDLFFIDTLHNGDHLYMELLRFAPLVKQRILFHDVSSFVDHDERPMIVAANFSTLNVSRPNGLREAIRMFLTATEEGKNWAEEVVFRHNNGLYVLRHRDWPVDASPLTVTSSGPSSADRFAALEGAYSPSFPAFKRGLMELCFQFVGFVHKSFDTVGVYNDPKKRVQRHCSKRKWPAVTAFQRAMAHPPFPLQTTLGLVNGLVKTMFATEANLPPTVLCGGCHASLVHVIGSHTKLLTSVSSFSTSDPAAVETAMAKVKSTVTLAVVSSLWLNRNFADHETLRRVLLNKVSHRFLIYGCLPEPLKRNLLPAEEESRFVLRSVHMLDAGLLFFERQAATEFHYVRFGNETARNMTQATGDWLSADTS
jgi:hypothetical protein